MLYCLEFVYTVQILLLSKVGGATCKSNVVAIMSRLLSKEVASTFSYLGRKGKESLSATPLRDVVLGML